MDNASNCDKLAEYLPDYLPLFRGRKARLRCLAHIFNLIAKVRAFLYNAYLRLTSVCKIFISFFFKTRKPKKKIQIAAGPRGSGFMRLGESDDLGDETEIVLDAGDDDELDEDDIAIEEEAEASLEAEADDRDEGQKEHNDEVAKTFRGKAIAMMAAKNIRLDEKEVKSACQIFPRVCSISSNHL